MWWFWADPHLDHDNIIKHCNRPYKNVQEMNEAMIDNYNAVVRGSDNVVIAGDLTLWHKRDLVEWKFISRLKGNKIFLKGNHDYWLGKGKGRYIYHRTIENQKIAVCHYPLRSWNGSTHGSWNLHGHSHGMLLPLRNQLDIGVDNAFLLLGEYRPFSFDEVKQFIKWAWLEKGTDDGEAKAYSICDQER